MSEDTRTIISAVEASPDGKGIVLQTNESGAVALDLSQENDNSGGWREVYNSYISAGGKTSSYNP